jgi:hypothetical protein
MTTHTAVTMQDLELESAELLPARETLWCAKSYPGSSSSFSVSQTVAGNGNHNGNGDGNGFLNIGSGDGDGDLNGNTIALQVL